jgi:hypothetical protein
LEFAKYYRNTLAHVDSLLMNGKYVSTVAAQLDHQCAADNGHLQDTCHSIKNLNICSLSYRIAKAFQSSTFLV